MSALPLPSPPPSPDRLAQFGAELRAQAWRLDLASLLALLFERGFSWDELRFSSHATTESQSRLVHDIVIEELPRRAHITLNLGLLAAQSPLPAYFFRELDAGTLDAPSFFRFLGFFDHVVLSRLVLATHPELDRSLVHDRERARREELQLLNLRSTATLHWLFQQVFPELVLQVEPVRKRRRLRTDAPCLGRVKLGGDSALGGSAIALGPGRRVTLWSEDERAGSDRPWPREARARLDELVLPLLRPLGLPLEVFLVLREPRSWARLAGGSHLGYDQLRGAHASQRIKLYDTSEEDKP